MMRFFTLMLLVLLGTSLLDAAEAESSVPPAKFKDGANCLFAGHSYFIPVALRFHQIATKSGFESHEAKMVFAPGMAGSPADLWNHPRKKQQIESELATGKIELFGLTAVAPNNSGFEDYQKWIDLALSYNPKTEFMIGQGWSVGGPARDAEAYDQSIELSGERVFQVVTELREAYADVTIHFINYGKMSSELKNRYEAGQLPDVTQLVGRGGNALFRDPTGHAGPMTLELSALAWLMILYGAVLEDLSYATYQSDVSSIVEGVVESNAKYGSQ